MTYRFGKLPVKGDYRIPRLQHYLLANLADPPEAHSVLDTLDLGPGDAVIHSLFPLHGNDRLQNAAVAAVAHAITAATLHRGAPIHVPSREVVERYLHLTGCSDQGLALTTVLNSFKLIFAGNGHGIRSFLSVDVSNLRQVRLAIQLFGGLCCGFQVTADCIEAFEAREPWRPGRVIDEGHAACVIAYDPLGVQLISWGRAQRATWDWWRECVDEAYVLLPVVLPLGTQAGLDWQQFAIDRDRFDNDK